VHNKKGETVMTDSNGQRPSEQDHVSTVWLERNVMDELARISAAVDETRDRVEAITLRGVEDLQQAHTHEINRCIDKLNELVDGLNRLTAAYNKLADLPAALREALTGVATAAATAGAARPASFMSPPATAASVKPAKPGRKVNRKRTVASR
jgi:ABC-type transporter Mla subunit MlaD